MVKKNNPSKDLRDEHDGILQMLSVMQSMIKELEAGKNLQEQHLGRVMEFLQNFADKCHHGKEEGILFPEISDRSLVEELLKEHAEGRKFIAEIRSSSNIAENMQGYINLLKIHIKKENEFLLPIANKLPKEKQDEMSEKFEILERDVIGQGKHEEYHSWLKEFKEIYL